MKLKRICCFFIVLSICIVCFAENTQPNLEAIVREMNSSNSKNSGSKSTK